METKNNERKDKIKRLVGAWGTALSRTLQEEGISLQMAYQNNILAPSIQAVIGPRLLTFVVGLMRSKDLSKLIKLHEQLALNMGAENSRIVRVRGKVLIEIPLPRQLRRDVAVQDLKRKEGLWLTLGKDPLMKEVRCELDSPNVAPILVAGRTGSGKTELLKLLIWQLAMQNSFREIQLVLIDPKQIKFEAFTQLPHLIMPVCTTALQGINAIAWLVKELQKRIAEKYNTPKIILVADEIISILEQGSDDSYSALGQLSSLGRELGIHLILATQRADRRYLDRLSAANIGLRLVGMVGDTVEARVAAGRGGTEAHKLGGKGDMLAVLSANVTRFQAGLVSDELLAELPVSEREAEFPGGIGIPQVRIARTVPFTADELATALQGKGIIRLKQELGMGQPRATRLRNLGQDVLENLSESGYNIVKGEENGEREEESNGKGKKAHS